MLALSCIAAIIKLGPVKISCTPFTSLIPDTTGRLMDKLVSIVPLTKAYYSMKDIGLRREFLFHFGSRAAFPVCEGSSDRVVEEMSFWVDLVQRQLQQNIDREKIWSRLTTSESIEVSSFQWCDLITFRFLPLYSFYILFFASSCFLGKKFKQ